jgi:HD superfamily phosphohydrolase
MYTSVYFHKTVRIAEMMLCKAVELAPKELLEGIQTDSDCSLTHELLSAGGPSARIMTMLRYRQLYKKAMMIPIAGLSDEQIQQLVILSDYKRRKAKEQEIAEKAGIGQEEVVLDIPEKSLLISEPRIGKTDVGILDGDRLKPLSRYSPLAKALQSRGVHDWAVMVSTPVEHRQEVEKAALKALFQ